MNKEKPINFSGEMVRAIIDGQKTQTRRIIKPQPSPEPARAKIWSLEEGTWHWESNSGKVGIFTPDKFKSKYQVGDRLWVREKLRGDGQPGNRRVGIVRYGTDGEMVLPCATCGWVQCLGHEGECHGVRMDLPWEWENEFILPQKMPRWASRITLEITNVRVERVQNISEEDAKAEGIEGPFDVGYQAYRIPGDTKPRYSCAKAAFEYFLNSTHGPGAWDRNDWVWVYEFRREK